jgi:uncharacterized RDD family membrane protein YckC
MNWYYALNGQQQGPVSADDLSSLLSSGTITPETLIWKEGMSDWLPLSTAAPEVTAAGTVGGPAKDLSVQQMREGVDAAAQSGMQFAGFWIRLVAKFIDGILLAIVNSGVNYLIFGTASLTLVDPNTGEIIAEEMAALGLMTAVNTGIHFAYAVGLIGTYGATLGKMAVGIKIVTAEGGKVSYLRAFCRELSEIISGLILLVGYIIAAFDSEKRTLHDHICSTRVIYKR